MTATATIGRPAAAVPSDPLISIFALSSASFLHHRQQHRISVNNGRRCGFGCTLQTVNDVDSFLTPPPLQSVLQLLLATTCHEHNVVVRNSGARSLCGLVQCTCFLAAVIGTRAIQDEVQIILDCSYGEPKSSPPCGPWVCSL